jgi:hypothetical protein
MTKINNEGWYRNRLVERFCTDTRRHAMSHLKPGTRLSIRGTRSTWYDLQEL